MTHTVGTIKRDAATINLTIDGTEETMGFFKRLFGGGERSADDKALHLYIKCQRCSRPVHVRVDLERDLAADYGDTAAEGYEYNKDVMDDRCFRMMRAQLRFDARRNELSRQVEGGTFISQQEYEALRTGADTAQS